MNDTHIGNPYPIIISIIFVISSSTAFYSLYDLELSPGLKDAGHYQFLTNIALCLSTFYFSINFIYHFFKLKSITNLKIYLSAICFSLNFIVSLVYWSLKIFVPELILSKDDSFPFSLDIKIHLLPLISTSLDYLLFMNRWNIPYLTGYSIVTFLTVLYWYWLEYLMTENSVYPYPFLNVETNLRIVIFAIVSLLAFVSFSVGKLIHPDFIPELEKAEEDFKKNE